MHNDRKYEKSNNFGKAIARLIKELKRFNILIILTIILSVAGSTLEIVAPDEMSKLTDQIAKGLIVNTDNITLINDQRFSPAGVLAPKSKADLAFIMHSLAWLSTNGVASIVCFPGIMYRGGAEQKIRKYLIDNNYIDCIIQLPDNLFYGTSIATCIMVLKKAKKDTNVLFIDASKEFVKVTNNNKLTEDNIKNIVDVFSNRKEIQYYSTLAKYQSIVDNNYNISVSTYVEKEDTREKIDIKELNQKIAETVKRENELRKAIDEIIKEIEE